MSIMDTNHSFSYPTPPHEEQDVFVDYCGTMDRKDKTARRIKELQCYVCNQLVNKKNIENHLFFGRISCLICRRKCGCSRFQRKNYTTSTDFKMHCDHNVAKWVDDPMKNLIKWLECESLLDYKIVKYVNCLKSLRYKGPWKCFFEKLDESFSAKMPSPITSNHSSTPNECNSLIKLKKIRSNNIKISMLKDSDFNPNVFLNDLSGSNSNSNSFTTNQNSSGSVDVNKSCIKINSREKPIKNSLPCESLTNYSMKLKSNGFKNDGYANQKDRIKTNEKYRPSTPIDKIDLPEDGRYLILDKPLEECPDCYRKFDVERYIFNLKTEQFESTCGECLLKFYFIFWPIDGTKPKLKVV